MSKIIDFYKDEQPDAAGRFFSDVMAFNDKEREVVHDYIQWAFPLEEASRFNPDAPLLTTEDKAAFKKDPILQKNFKKSCDMMLDFYGLKKDDQTQEISKASHFKHAASNWLTPENHNFLRISRILRCMTLLGEEKQAAQLFKALDGIYQENSNIIGDRTFGFWKSSSEMPEQPSIIVPQARAAGLKPF